MCAVKADCLFNRFFVYHCSFQFVRSTVVTNQWVYPLYCLSTTLVSLVLSLQQCVVGAFTASFSSLRLSIKILNILPRINCFVMDFFQCSFVINVLPVYVQNAPCKLFMVVATTFGKYKNIYLNIFTKVCIKDNILSIILDLA